MSDDPKDRPYKVGKGKPPVEHRWKKGQPSPNPNGRPKRPTPQTELLKMLRQKVWVTGSDGRRVQKSCDEVIAHKLIQRAVNGDFDAIKFVSQLAAKQRIAELCQPPPAVQQPSAEELAEREQLSREIVDFLDEMAELKSSSAERVRFGPDGQPIEGDSG